MDGSHKRLVGISNLMQSDIKGNLLVEEVLNACFDYSLMDLDFQPGLVEDRAEQLTRLMDVLDRFNGYVSQRYPLFKEGLFQGTEKDVAIWSENLTSQIMMNRPN